MASPIPTNRAPFTLAEIVAATGGRVLHAGDERASGVSTDTRTIESGNVFVALEGERFDGHDHVDAAVARGASAIVVRKDAGKRGKASVIEVGDTERALGALGRAHRRRWARASRGERQVVAVTGSAGKTTTRSAIAALVRSLGRSVHASAGNLNNQIGVPMTLFGLAPEHALAVVEIGTNRRGEIAYGAGIAEPEIGVLTLVSEAHGEGLGTIWDIAKEKGDLLLSLPPEGVAIANADDARAAAQLVRSPAKRWLGYGEAEGVGVRLVARTPRGLKGSDVTLAFADASGGEARVEATVPLLGRAGAYAAAAAAAVALALEEGRLEPAALGRALVELGANEPGRLGALERDDGTVIIDDAYNANPISMRASIEAASEIARSLDRRLVLVLGEMRELGPRAGALHDEVRGAIAAAGAAVVIGVAGHAKAFVTGLPQGVATAFADDAARAADLATAHVKKGDVVLFKASNSIGLSKIAEGVARG